MTHDGPHSPNSPLSRRELLGGVACGFGSIALAGLVTGEARGATNVALRAKRVIFVFMQGGPSQVDTFEHKPRLDRDHGRKLEFRVARTRKVTPERVMKSPWSFSRYGKCGHEVSELFPHVAKRVDDLCFIHGMHTNGVAHGPSTLFLHTGATNLVRPSVGSWVTYGLGTENRNLPGFITIQPSLGNGGPRNYSNAFLPAAFQGTPLGRAGGPIENASIRNLANERHSPAFQRRRFDLLRALNEIQTRRDETGNDEIDATIESFELAYRMQIHAPGLTDIAGETERTKSLYGIDEKETRDFGTQCLLARRMAEAGVRYVQVNYADNGDNPRWDQHSNLPLHAKHAKAVDKPIAGLLLDLKQRGLLEDTLVWWGGEFGRNPFAQNNGTGRDHNPNGFTHFLAGGGVKAGYRYGATDEFGHKAVVDPVHMHDLHATVLHLLGLDHERLTYRYAGRDFRLTDVAGEVVRDILA